jgi:energy-coupling factor transporter ATP-binding protein EcfA2
MASKYTFKNASKMLKLAFDLSYFDPAEKVIDYRWDPKQSKSNFVVVVGENAAGKSFLRRILSSVAHRAKIEAMPVSMEHRQTGGAINAFVYGSETYDATGKNSAGTVLTGIKTCQGRETPHIIIWDEPDLGLSESWARSMGQTFRGFAESLPENTKAAVVITHSKPLLRELVAANPQFVYLGTQAIDTLEQWLEYEAPVRPLEQLAEECHTRFKKLSKLLKRLGIRT